MIMRAISTFALLNLPFLLSVNATEDSVDIIEVQGRHLNLLGRAISASEGGINQNEIEIRPLLRTGDILEFVPGMVVTQHSGTGKANQYFLRGFNLDHGTDFSTFIDNMPINMRSHGHGQGYTDLNFIIPETISQLNYKKGGYYASVGDFSGAGSAKMYTGNHLDNSKATLSLSGDNYLRLMAINSVGLAQGGLLTALEYNKNDGPWSQINERLDKKNILLKYEMPFKTGQLSLNLMAYDNNWNSADQIPTRAVDQGIIDPLGSLDTSLGGKSSRYSFSANWQGQDWQVSGYAIQYDMRLWSNFTYFLDNPDAGDQFEQVDKRYIYGANTQYVASHKWGAFNVTHTVGSEFRFDDINEVGLYKTHDRVRLGPVRNDAVSELSAAIFWENLIHWSDNLRSVLGARTDYYQFKVTDLVGQNINLVDLSANSGEASESITSIKGSLIYTLNDQWESYVSAGEGFHSNDARGTTTQFDPNNGSTVFPVDPLVKSFGYEVGLRGFINQKLNTSFALWSLNLDSELLFVGDAGITEASHSSSRQGLEMTAYYHFTPHLSFDIEYAYTDAKFTGVTEDNYIPGAIKHVLQTGFNASFDTGLFGSLRLRYFGKRPLTEDASVVADASSIINLRLGYKLDNWTFKADILNLSNSRDHDIDYFYESQLKHESQPVEDIHYHAFEPKKIILSISYSL